MCTFVSGGDSPSLEALSLAGCQMNDKDLLPLATAVKGGMPLHMLKVSGNRLGDPWVEALVDGLKSHKTHPLGLVDASNNRVY